MPAGFAQPTVLFAGNSAAPDRAFYSSVFTKLDKTKYTRYVELGVGSFAASLVAAESGFSGKCMETSDVTLYTSIVGTCVAGGDLDKLGMRLDGELVDLGPGPITRQAARLIFVHWLARLQAKPDVAYWKAIAREAELGQAEHEEGIERSLAGMVTRLRGLRYWPSCMWDHAALAVDDPNALVLAAPPTFKAGFESFFNTGDRVTWDEPSYEVFDPETGFHRLAEMFEGKSALLLFLHEGESRKPAHPRPVFAHQIGAGRTAYVLSNRPDEIFALTGGPKVIIGTGVQLQPSPWPTIPADYEITEKSTVEVTPMQASVADWYRNLWLHRLQGNPNPYNLGVLVDGHLAGIFGYTINPMSRPFSAKAGQTWTTEYVILRYAVGAPHMSRLTRLVTMLAMQERSARKVLVGEASLRLEASLGLVTVEMTRHPEVKGLRGLMKQVERQKHPDGYKLTYTGSWSTGTASEGLREWLTKEQTWQNTRK